MPAGEMAFGDEEQYDDCNMEDGEIREERPKTNGGRVKLHEDTDAFEAMESRVSLIEVGAVVDSERTREMVTTLIESYLRHMGPGPAGQAGLAALQAAPIMVDASLMLPAQGTLQTRKAVMISHKDKKVIEALDAAQTQADQVMNVYGVTLKFMRRMAAASRAASEPGEEMKTAFKARAQSIMLQLQGCGVDVSDENLDEICDQLSSGLQMLVPTVLRCNEFDDVQGNPPPAAQHSHMHACDRHIVRSLMYVCMRTNAGKFNAQTCDGCIRVHVECEHHLFQMPENIHLDLTKQDGVVRYYFNRFTNMAVLEDEYNVCCGAIGRHMPECHKTQKRPRVERPVPVCLPSEVALNRKKYVKEVMDSVCPQIVEQTLLNQEGTKRFKAYPSACKAWTAHVHKKKTNAGQCAPGTYCAKNCKQFPCVAVVAERPEELIARGAYHQRIEAGTRA